ncbi:GIY-YIG nuclease family protein [Acidovorax radicis]|uniref:GIY-YIG nuclease family protein n=1 Tax=Acidovorax radicis TaxID=758826 RepID=UPI00023777D7|nr:GIY-YIG nuclease family protein [Acidovorax radicis]
MTASTAQDGFIYIFRHDRLHNEIKVGLSKNPFKRVMQLHTTATATPMNISVIWWVSDMRTAERIAHNRLADHRINRRREFFLIAPPNDFDEFERMCYDTTTICLEVLEELIEGDWAYAGLRYGEMDVHKMYEAYLRGEDVAA